MAAPAAVFLKNERRLCVDTVLELLTRHSFGYYRLFWDRFGETADQVIDTRVR